LHSPDDLIWFIKNHPPATADNVLQYGIANWLIRLTDNHRNWGFGLCYLYLRNVKNFG